MDNLPTEEEHVIGPPGCGKTTYLGRQAALAAKVYGENGVTVCSLTKAAATEAAGRNIPINSANIGTLHALAFRSMDKPVIAESKIADWNEEHKSMQITAERKSIDEQSAGMESKYENNGDELLAKMGLLRATQTLRELWPADVRAFAKQWEGWCSEGDMIDFTGLIENALEFVDCAPGIPDVILADEAQDYSRLEHALLQKWGAYTKKLILCADPDQAIYEWRGADPKIFIDNPVPDKNKHILSQSYRVPPAVHAFAQKIIRRIKSREDVEYKPRDAEGLVTNTTASYRFPEPLIKLCEQHTEGKREGDIMILASCDYMLQSIVILLREAGIPFHNPYRRTNGAWNPLQRRKKGAVSSIDRLLAYLKPGYAGDPEDELDILRHWTFQDIKRFTEHMRSGDILRRGAKKEIAKLAVKAAKGEKRSGFGAYESDVKEYYDYILFQNEEVASKSLERNVQWFMNSLLESKKDVYKFPVEILKKRGFNALANQPKVIVGTVHSVKGGEADTVVMFPDLSPRGAQGYMSNQNEYDAIIRVFYVAITRARREVILGSQSSRNCISWR